jgi:hypothetical protein
MDAGSWWRGVSVALPYYGQQRESGGVVPVVQTAAGGALGSERNALLQRLPVAIWTFRTFMDVGAPALPISASAQRTAAGVRVTLGGFPDEARVTRAAMLVKGGWLVLPDDVQERTLSAMPRRLPADRTSPEKPRPAPPLGERDAGAWRAEFQLRFKMAEAPGAWAPGAIGTQMRMYPGARGATDSPGALLEMPGAAERTGSLDALAATGKWAIVHLKVEGWPADYSVSWPAKYTHTRILRLAVPLEER